MVSTLLESKELLINVRRENKLKSKDGIENLYKKEHKLVYGGSKC